MLLWDSETSLERSLRELSLLREYSNEGERLLAVKRLFSHLHPSMQRELQMELELEKNSAFPITTVGEHFPFFFQPRIATPFAHSVTCRKNITTVYSIFPCFTQLDAFEWGSDLAEYIQSLCYSLWNLLYI